MTPDQRDDPLIRRRRLNHRRRLARLVLLFERVWPAIWPAVGVIGVFICLALLDIPARLPAFAQIVLLASVALTTAFLLIRGLRGLAMPDAGEGDRRLEREAGLRHRPLAVLTDRPARLDDGGAALWQAHVARAAAQVSRLRVGLPRPGLARRDQRALRAGLLVALVAAVVIAGPDAPSRLAGAIEPNLPPKAVAPGTQIQAWIIPPAYTRLAPVFLKPEGGSVSVPAGSHLTVNVTGGEGEPGLSRARRAVPFRALDATSFEADDDLSTGGRIALRRGGGEVAAWDLTVIADQPPVAAWSEPPGRAARSLQTRLPWQVSDDYGVTSLQVEMRLEDRPDAPPLVVTVPLPGGSPKAAKGVGLQDLTAHPWAGLPVRARLIARDAIGQSGESGEADFRLPERSFQNPVARTLINIRKLLSIHPEDRDPPIAVLEELLRNPDALALDTGAYVNLAAIRYLLAREQDPAVVPEAQERLWDLALHIEEGATETTARALEAARAEARDALDKAAREQTDENMAALDQKLKELEDAIQRHMEALAEQARREMAEMPNDPDAPRFDSRQLESMAEKAREAAREGRLDEARQRMAELAQLLDQLRDARPMHRDADRRKAAGRRRGRQQQSVLQDLIARQGNLLDHAQQRSSAPLAPPSDPGDDLADDGDADQAQPAPPGYSQPGAPRPGLPRSGAAPGHGAPRSGANWADRRDGGSGDPAAQRVADRQVQQALRRALGELMQQFGDLTGQVPPSLGDAEGAMREAAQALAGGHDNAAGEAELRAVQALQKGGQAMSQQVARQFGPGQPGEGDDGDGITGFSLQEGAGDPDGSGQGTLPGQRGRGARRDPLGRPLAGGSSGADETSDVEVPEEMERQRTRAIQDELRRRGADRARPQQELDYIDRLLKQF